MQSFGQHHATGGNAGQKHLAALSQLPRDVIGYAPDRLANRGRIVQRATVWRGIHRRPVCHKPSPRVSNAFS